jgi:RNA polymerase sigma factor (sigma-70 family)
VDWQDRLRRLRRRDPTAQREVYEAYRQRLYAALRRFDPLGTVYHADCIQDGIVDAFRELFNFPERFDPDRAQAGDPLLAYLIGIARRRIIDCWRHVKRDAISHPASADLRPEPEDADPDDPPGSPIGEATAPPAARTLDDAIADLYEGSLTPAEFTAYVELHVDLPEVVDRLDRLTDVQRQVILLKHLAGFRTREIMQLLDLTEDTVEGILRRARDILRRSQKP